MTGKLETIITVELPCSTRLRLSASPELGLVMVSLHGCATSQSFTLRAEHVTAIKYAMVVADGKLAPYRLRQAQRRLDHEEVITDEISA